MRRMPRFNRLDSDRAPRDEPKPKPTAAETALAEYAIAYFDLASRNPKAVRSMPHPSGPADFDAKAALETLRRLSSGLQAVPKVEIEG